MPLLPAGQVREAIARRTRSAEEAVCALWSEHAAAALPDAAVLAVGGFGRAEMFPYSDVDVLLLFSGGAALARSKEPLGRFIQACWDAGMRLSHSARTVEDCVTIHDGNLELNTSLLDRRRLCGAPEPSDEVEARWPKFHRLHGGELARGIARLTRERHAKFHNTIYQLEPDVKDAPGALRDLHVSRWMAALLDSPGERDLSAAWDLFAALRYRLHERAGRDRNVLDFEAQDDAGDSPDELMRDYFRCARSVLAETRRLLQVAEDRSPSLFDHFRDWRARLSNSEFTVSRERVFLKSPAVLEHDRGVLVRLFAFLARHKLQLAPDTESRVRKTVQAGGIAELRWEDWRAILSEPNASFALRAAQDTGVLAAWLPDWRRVECLVVRDFYHRYTVDEHTLVTIETLEFIDDGRFRGLLGEIDRPDLLRFALLLHDIGKGGGDHVRVSAQLAAAIAERTGIPESDAATVRFLIEQHLLLSAAATSRDLADPATAAEIAEAAGTVERLKLLTLLTYADIAAVHPGALTPWRAEQLWRVYLAGYAELTRALETERIHDLDGAPEGVAEFVEGFPTRYQRTHTLSEMKAHLQLAARAADAGAAVEVAALNGFYRASVVAQDRPGLLAAISGALASFGLSILKAEAFANVQGTVLDVFVFADPRRNLELNPDELDGLRQTLVRVALGREDVTRLLRRRPPSRGRASGVQPVVRVENAPGVTATRIEVVAEDRPGLLYDLTSTLSAGGCDIDVVMIDTEGHRALDVFYVRRNGAPLADNACPELQQELLEACRSDPAKSSGSAGAVRA